MRETLQRLFDPREGLGSAVFAAGVALALSSGAMELFELGVQGFGVNQVRLLRAGIVVAAAGAALDWLAGGRWLAAWLRAVIPSPRHFALLLGIALQAWLLLVVSREYALENVAFYGRLLPMAISGFVVHHFLPPRWRLPFFLAVSFAALVNIVGFANTAWILGTGVILIGIGHLPVRFWGRVALLVAAAGALAVLRGGLLPGPVPPVIWPIAGSMFMFRLIVFLYDREHEKEPAPWPQRLAYFFLLPNVVFPLFPVVDYKTFRRTYYDEDWPAIYQRGVDWMFRGMIQLLLYRLVNVHLVMAPEEVTNAGTLAQYLAANFGLYLRVSGQFHLIAGLLHLFGFHLPQTNQLYFLASSFTDFWRRINIYWKDFMMKVFYYPAYFRLTRFGAQAALALATLWVFLVTWLLHAYQWFWLRGSFLLSPTDMLFWSVLALLVVANSLYEARFGRKRSLSKATWTAGRLAALGLRTSATFTAICALWSLWTSTSVRDWLSLWRAGLTWEGIGVLLGVFLLPGLVAAGAQWAAGSGEGIPGALAGMHRLATAPVATVAMLAVLYGLTTPDAFARLNPGMQGLVGDLRVPKLSRRDSDLLRRGYYENLTPTNDITSPLWQVLAARPRGIQAIEETAAARDADPYLDYELLPNVRILFRGEPFQTNRWGMRDRDYGLMPPPGAYRVALVGASHGMGAGLADGEAYESVFEEQVNRENGSGSLEILNFAVAGYAPWQLDAVLDGKVGKFRPHAVIFEGHPSDFRRSSTFLVSRVLRGAELPHPWMREIIRQAGIEGNTPGVEGAKRLRPAIPELTGRLYAHWVESCRKMGAQPVFLMLPSGVGKDLPKEDLEEVLKLAQESGLLVVNLMDVYDGRDPQSLYLAEWDRHPNVRGHQVIAERLARMLRENPGSLLPGFPASLGKAGAAPAPPAQR